MIEMGEVNSQLVMPNVGDEVRVSICPSVHSDEKWMQVGSLLAVRQESFGLIVGNIQITRKLTAEENTGRWLTTDEWPGCEVTAVYNPYSNDWRATRTVCDRAKRQCDGK
jgi:hypothetical protein